MRAGRSRFAIQDGIEDDRRSVAAKWNEAGSHLVKNRSEGEQIGAGVEFLALGLLRRHVGYSSDGGAWAGQIFQAHAGGGLALPPAQRVGLAGSNFCQAEIENLGVAALGDKNVGRLDVAMDNAFGVRRIECVGDLNRQAQQHFSFEWPAGDTMLQRHTIQKLHGDEGLAVFFADFVNGADVGMVQCGS